MIVYPAGSLFKPLLYRENTSMDRNFPDDTGAIWIKRFSIRNFILL